MLNKSDLIIKIANLNPSIYQKDATKIVNVFFDTITKVISLSDLPRVGKEILSGNIKGRLVVDVNL